MSPTLILAIKSQRNIKLCSVIHLCAQKVFENLKYLPNSNYPISIIFSILKEFCKKDYTTKCIIGDKI